MNRLLGRLLTAGLGLLITLNVQAALEVIQLDYADVTDFDAIPDPGGNWNSLSGTSANTTVSNLIDFNTGLATGISVTGNGWTGGTFASDNFGDFSPQKDWVAPLAAQDAVFTEIDGAGTITFSGLTKSLYSVEVVAADDAFNPISDIQVNANFADRNFENIMGVNGDDFDQTVDGFTPANWLIWDNVTPAGGGDITITIMDTNSVGSNVNAVRVAAVIPEPETYLMFATILIGAAAFLINRNHKQKEEENLEQSAS